MIESGRITLAVDLGTSGMKVALVAMDGTVLGWDFEPVKLYLTSDGGAEQSPQEWWQAFLTAAGRLIGRNLVDRSKIRAVCCSTQGEGTLPVDRNGDPLMNCILWMDMRGAPALQKQIRGTINVAGADPIKLLQWLQLTGGMPSLTGKDPSAHMLLVRDQFPQVYERTYKFLNVLDFLNLRLTGRFAATFDSIVTSWVTDNRNPDSICYDAALVHNSGIDFGKFPEIVPCTSVLGELRSEVTEQLGLTAGVQVVAGSIDTTAAAIGSGAVEDFAAHLYLGTSSWIAAHVPFKKTDITSRMASIPCAIPGKYLLIALQATAGGNLTYLRDNILYHKDELLQEAGMPDLFKVLDQIAERTPAGSNGVIYTPWLWGERAPVEDLSLRAGVYNLSLQNSREDIIRAFLEGIALNSRWLLEPVNRFLGKTVNHLNLVGGGAQSDVWCQIYADVMGLEVRQLADPIQTNARGAAWITAVALGEIAFQDIPALVKYKKRYSPDPKNRALYNERFQIFLQIHRQMSGIYKRLNRS